MGPGFQHLKGTIQARPVCDLPNLARLSTPQRYDLDIDDQILPLLVGVLSTPQRYDSDSGRRAHEGKPALRLSTPWGSDSGSAVLSGVVYGFHLSTPRRYDSSNESPKQARRVCVLSTPQRYDSSMRRSWPKPMSISFQHLKGTIQARSRRPRSRTGPRPSFNTSKGRFRPVAPSSGRMQRRTFNTSKGRFSRAIMARIAYTVGHFQRHKGTIRARSAPSRATRPRTFNTTTVRFRL